MKRVLYRLLLSLLAVAPTAVGQEDVVMKAMRDELSRSVAQLRLANLDKPYFISYRIDDTTRTDISATLGQLTGTNSQRSRDLDVQVRVGDYGLDNTNFLGAGPSARFTGGGCGCNNALPLDDDYGLVRRQLWLATDSQYKDSAANLASKRSVLQHRQKGQELPDFTPQAPATVAEVPIDLRADVSALEKLARELSAVFRDSPEVVSSSVHILVSNTFTRFVDSEGTAFTRPEPVVALYVRAYTQAKDGLPLAESFQVYGRSASTLHGEELVARGRNLLARLKALRAADSVENYNGPVLFEGEAAAQVVAQVFAPAIVAWRFPLSDQPQYETPFKEVLNQFGASLADRVGGRVMADMFDLTDNPGADSFTATPLMGSSRIDDEGAPARELQVVEHGTLKALLANRTPTPQTKATTGSQRAVGVAPSNLFLTARTTKTSEELRKELLRVAKQRGYEYGIVVRQVSPGSLSALMRLASSMGAGTGDTTAVGVYKIFQDGHEELVRADLGPVPIAAFKDILAAGDKPGVYHSPFLSLSGMGIGERGRNLAIVSYIVPSLLFEEVSLKQPAGPAPRPPLVPAPVAFGN